MDLGFLVLLDLVDLSDSIRSLREKTSERVLRTKNDLPSFLFLLHSHRQVT